MAVPGASTGFPHPDGAEKRQKREARARPQRPHGGAHDEEDDDKGHPPSRTVHQPLPRLAACQGHASGHHAADAHCGAGRLSLLTQPPAATIALSGPGGRRHRQAPTDPEVEGPSGPLRPYWSCSDPLTVFGMSTTGAALPVTVQVLPGPNSIPPRCHRCCSAPTRRHPRYNLYQDPSGVGRDRDAALRLRLLERDTGGVPRQGLRTGEVAPETRRRPVAENHGVGGECGIDRCRPPWCCRTGARPRW